MKIFRFVPIAAALALFVSCQKQHTEAERHAEVERQVQERLAAERQATEQQRIAQQAADLEAREKALAEKEAAVNQTAIAAATPRRDTESETETRTRVTSSQDESEQSYDTFYRKLEPYGAWRETSAYGYVWQPRAAQQSRDWRPYTDGRWAYTDAGWTWISAEPFGWATYHYGRWARLSGVGWIWVPGDEWAAAWVSWREGGDHVGWAPLPPEAHFEKSKGIKKWADSYYDIDADEYVFLPNEDIGAENVRQYALPPERNATIVLQTTNVTDITYNNRTVISQGPSYDALRSRARQAPPRLRLERESNVTQDAAPHARIRGETLAVVAPIVAAAGNARPRTEGTPITQMQVERNWTRGNQADAQRAREKMRGETTPPADAPAKRYDKPVISNAPPTPAAIPATTATAAPVTTAPPAAAATATATATPIATTAPRAMPTVVPRQRPSATIAPEALPTPEGQGSPLSRGGGVNERREQQRKTQEDWLRQHGGGAAASVTPHATVAPESTATPAGIQLTPPPNQKRPAMTPPPFRRPQPTPVPNDSSTPASEAASPAGAQNQPPPGRGRPRGGPRAQPAQTASPSPTPP